MSIVALILIAVVIAVAVFAGFLGGNDKEE